MNLDIFEFGYGFFSYKYTDLSKDRFKELSLCHKLKLFNSYIIAT